MAHAEVVDVVARRGAERTPQARNAWGVWVALALTLAMNALASWLPLAGRTTGEISDRFPVMITPAGYTFSVWGVIYLGLLAFAVYQTLPRHRARAAVADVRPPFVATCVLNAAWLVAWHNLWITAAMAIIAALWGALAFIHLRLRRRDVEGAAADRWFLRAPFGLYFGWITAATLVNLRVLTYAWGWTGGGAAEVAWTLGTILVVASVAVAIVRWSFDLAFGAVAAWALVGVAVANGSRPLVAGAALAGAAVVVLAGAWVGFQHMQAVRPRTSTGSR